jgi:subtilisin family serine protease
MRPIATAALALLLAASISPVPAAAASGVPSVPSATPGAPGGAASAPAAEDPATDVAGRWIVVLRSGADVAKATSRARGLGARPDHAFHSALRGYSAKLTATQVASLRRDPDVVSIVPDAVIGLEAQTMPTGVKRVFGPRSLVAGIDGVDERVDADVAVVDTGIDPTHPDLNVVGGVNCSTSDPNAWQDQNGHGTHVAGIVGAIDNGAGVVGVAPGVRLWSVRILDKNGTGRVSWYVCGLDWITAQRDPADPTRPLIEAVNMSVARAGSDDHACGTLNDDVMHQAICRLVASGVTVVAAAGNDSFSASRLIPAAYNEVITVSALADTDGKPGGLGGNRCYSWGTYDRDDTFADFSNYGRDVDLIAPGKCIWSTLPGNRYGYLSGTSMAAPHVTGAAALYKASRPDASPSQVKAALQAAGTLDWNVATDPDPYHERLLDVARIVAAGDFTVDATSPTRPLSGAGGTVNVPVLVVRAEDFPDEVDLAVDAPDSFQADLGATQLTGLDGTSTSLVVTVPAGTPSGTYTLTVQATSGDRVRSVAVTIPVDADPPSMLPPRLGPATGTRFDTTTFTARAAWPAASDAAGPVTGYQVSWSVDGGGWSAATGLGASTLETRRTFRVGHSYRVRVRAKDAVGNWSAWVTNDPFKASVVQDRSSSLVRTGPWHRSYRSSASGGTLLYATRKGASISRTFTGRGVGWVAPKGPVRGKAQVWVDGVLIRTVNLHASSFAARRMVFARCWATTARHTIRIVVLGTAGHPRVDLDALVIVR